MVNYIDLQNHLIENPDKIVVVLESLGFDHIIDRNKYYQFPNKDGDNQTACSILKSTLQYNNYTRGKKGNLFTLVKEEKNLDFKECLEYISSKIKYKTANYSINYPFNHFYKNFLKQQLEPELYLKHYPETILPPSDSLSKKWLDDGVDLLTQERFGIRYDHETDKILIPERDYSGSIVGVKERNNDPNCKDSERWGMYIPWSKSQTVYGWYENYKDIQRKKKCFVFESEKSVCQLSSYGINLGLAIGGHNFSPTQSRYIKGLLCNEIIVAFDEGICREEIEHEARKLVVNNLIYHNKVGYIFDDSKSILLPGSKNSPSDIGLNNFLELYKNHVFYIT